jgi:hypothetical protein
VAELETIQSKTSQLKAEIQCLVLDGLKKPGRWGFFIGSSVTKLAFFHGFFH